MFKFKSRRLAKESGMTKIAPMYVYATEMVGDYYERLGLRGKTVLTIAGSGDQILNAYFFGAKRVVGFDINERASYMAQLKIAALQTLSYNDFLKFFGSKKSNVGFSFVLYRKIRMLLGKRPRLFFNHLYSKFHNNGQKLVGSNYFRQRSGIGLVTPTTINAYLKNETAYLKLKKNILLVKFEFVSCDLKDVPQNKLILKSRFDVINLSNAPNYFVRYHNAPLPLEYFMHLLLKFHNLLTKNGRLFYYAYSSRNFPNPRVMGKTSPPLSKKESIDIIRSLKKFKVSSISFKGVAEGRDKIVIFTRR